MAPEGASGTKETTKKGPTKNESSRHQAENEDVLEHFLNEPGQSQQADGVQTQKQERQRDCAHEISEHGLTLLPFGNQVDRKGDWTLFQLHQIPGPPSRSQPRGQSPAEETNQQEKE